MIHKSEILKENFKKIIKNTTQHTIIKAPFKYNKT